MEKKDALSRRNFIKASSMAALGAAALGLAGCGPKPAQNSANDAATSVADIAWDEEYDVIVVGAGAAGLATAVAMATEGGDLSTLLLEKGSTLIGSGNSPVCSGSFHITDEPDAFAVYMKAMLGGMSATPASVYETYAQGAAENWKWLSGLGMKEDDVKVTPQGDGKAEWFELENSGSFSKCQFKKDNADEDRTHISKFLSSVLEQYPDQVTRKTSAPLTALVQDPETKAVIGAVYEDKNKSVYAKARKGVVMTCGGFENDPEMLQDYLSFERMHAAGASTNTGDGHRICAKLGAGMWHMNSFAGAWSNGISLDGEKTMPYRSLKKALGIVVGVNGRRFYQEWEGTTMFTKGEEGPLSLHYGCRHGHQNFGGEWKMLPCPTSSGSCTIPKASASAPTWASTWPTTRCRTRPRKPRSTPPSTRWPTATRSRPTPSRSLPRSWRYPRASSDPSGPRSTRAAVTSPNAWCSAASPPASSSRRNRTPFPSFLPSLRMRGPLRRPGRVLFLCSGSGIHSYA